MGRRTVCLLALVAVVVAACGGDTKSAPTTTTTSMAAPMLGTDEDIALIGSLFEAFYAGDAETGLPLLGQTLEGSPDVASEMRFQSMLGPVVNGDCVGQRDSTTLAKSVAFTP